MYGDYLYSHNVNPHRGSRSPTYVQSYPTALVRANSMKTLIPVPPRTLSQLPSQSGAEPSAKDNGLKIYPRCNEFGPLRIETPKLEKISKFTLRGYLCRDENQITNATDYLNNNKEADIVHHGNK